MSKITSFGIALTVALLPSATTFAQTPRTLAEIHFDSQQYAYFHDRSVAVVRCLLRQRSNCRHPALGPKTQFMSVSGGDAVMNFGFGPAAQAAAVRMIQDAAAFEYRPHEEMPIPLDRPKPRFTATIDLFRPNARTGWTAHFNFNGDRVESVSLSPMRRMTGVLP